MQIAFTVPAGISLGWSSSLLGDGWWLVGRKELFAAVPFCREIGASETTFTSIRSSLNQICAKVAEIA